jgi:hypothetical protein
MHMNDASAVAIAAIWISAAAISVADLRYRDGIYAGGSVTWVVLFAMLATFAVSEFS